MYKKRIWKDFRKFCKEAEFFGTSWGWAYITNGLDSQEASDESKKSTYSLLYIKMIAIFSDQVIQYCDNNKINTDDNRLKILLDKLENKHCVELDFKESKRIREKRNDISHKVSFLINKDEFDYDQKIIENQIEKLSGLI